MFSINITAENMDDAMDIYSSILNTRCRDEAHAQLQFQTENGENKILSKDEVKRYGVGHAGFCGKVHPVQ